MKKIYFTVGPAQLYPTVDEHMRTAIAEQIGSVSHRGDFFESMYFDTAQRLKDFLSIPKDYHIFFISSATEGMERTIQNCVEHESFHFINGVFSQKFFTMSQQHYKDAKSYVVDISKLRDYNNITVPKNAEVIAITQNETSNGWMFLERDITAIKKSHPNSLVAVDIVSSVPYVKLDFSYTDIAFFSVQKGFGLPAGLAVVIVSPQAFEKAQYMEKQKTLIGSYHTFPSLAKYARDGQTPETANVLGLYLFSKVLKDMQENGIDKIRQKIEKNAHKIYDALSIHTTLTPLIQVPEHRSQTIMVAKGTALSEIHQRAKKNNLVIGKGYGEFEDTQIRIGNFPAHRDLDIEMLLKVLK